MDVLSLFLLLLFYLLVASPLSLILHELGHAAMVLLLTKQKVRFQFGRHGPRWDASLGRLATRVYFEPSSLFFCRYYLEDKAALSKSQDFGITLGGPLTSFSLTLLFGVLWLVSETGGDPWEGLTIINLLMFLNSAAPQHYPDWQGAAAGIPSDGMQLLEILRLSNK